jgi:hypothetical protein
MRLVALAAVLTVAISNVGIGQEVATPAEHLQKQRHLRVHASAESRVDQASEKLRSPNRSTLPPEGAALGSTPKKSGGARGTTAGQSTHCTEANASSTECYTSTQQGRPLIK